MTELSRQLFDAIDTGFCIIEVLFDGERPCDYLFLEVNPAFERHTGIMNGTGRRMREVAPAMEQHWFDVYGRVVTTGEPARFDNWSEPLGRWFEVQAHRVGDPDDRHVAVLFSDITDRRRSELAHRESEERLDQALSAGRGIGTWDWDVPSNLVRADERFARMYGVNPARAAEGAPILDYFGAMHPADLAPTQAKIDEALRTGEPFRAEYRLVQPDGGVRWAAAQGRCRLGVGGEPLRFPGVSFDVTEQHEAATRQAALLELGDRIADTTDAAEIAHIASEILAKALDVSRAGYGIIDRETETIAIERDWNAPGVQSIAGVLQFRDYGSYIDQLKAGETVVIANARHDPRTRDTADALAGISALSFINMPLIEQGRFVALFFANNAVPRPWTDGELALMREIAGRVRAATERVRAEEARRHSEEQFRIFTQSVPNQIWAADAHGRIYWCNDQVFAYSGGSKGALGTDTSIDWSRIVHRDDMASVAAAWNRARTDGGVYETEFRIRRHDGAFRWFLVRAEPVRGGDGSVVGWVGTNTDIDDQRRFAERLEAEVAARTRELMQAEEALRQSQKMEAVGQLSGGLAHDFNNLLTGITGSLELMGVRIAQGRFADVERYTAAAQGAAKRAAALTHRLLAFSRRQTLDPKATDVNRLVAGLEELIRRTVGPENEVEVVAAGGLWSTLVDPNQLENAILNLAINARDAMPDGGRLTIETGNRWLDARTARERDMESGQYVSICVSDTGAGMPPEVIAKAFDPFFTTKPIGVGTGLGLSMIYGFARQSGGQVRIYSEVGEGAMVCIYLPRHLGPAEAPEDIRIAELPRASDGETVLVVDDEPTVRMLVMEVLEELGYHAIEAADGASGLTVLQSAARIALLITDVGLPGGMNGRQMADAARVGRPDLRILFITGYAENAVVGNGHLDPGMHVMTKPYAKDALAGRIRELIERG
jgi:PAS domain S-box-containing protein